MKYVKWKRFYSNSILYKNNNTMKPFRDESSVKIPLCKAKRWQNDPYAVLTIRFIHSSTPSSFACSNNHPPAASKQPNPWMFLQLKIENKKEKNPIIKEFLYRRTPKERKQSIEEGSKEKPPLFFWIFVNFTQSTLVVCVWEATLRNTRTTLKNLISTRDFQSAFDICTLNFNGYLTVSIHYFLYIFWLQEHFTIFINSVVILKKNIEFFCGFIYQGYSKDIRITNKNLETSLEVAVKSYPTDDIVLSQQYFFILVYCCFGTLTLLVGGHLSTIVFFRASNKKALEDWIIHSIPNKINDFWKKKKWKMVAIFFGKTL